MAITLKKSDFYEKLVDYYYDNVHFAVSPTPSIYEWASKEYGATIYRYHDVITFKRGKDATAFTLRWA